MLDTIKSLIDGARRTRHHAATLTAEADANDRKVAALIPALTPEEKAEYDAWQKSRNPQPAAAKSK